MADATPPQNPEPSQFVLPEAVAYEPIPQWPPTPPTPAPLRPSDHARAAAPWFGVGAGVYVLLMIAAAVMGGPAGDILAASLQVLPLAFLGTLAYMGLRRPWALVLASCGFAVLIFSVLLIPPVVGVAIFLLAQATKGQASTPSYITWFTTRGGNIQLLLLSIWSVLGLMAAIAGLIPDVRRWVAQRLPFDARSPINAFALSLVACATVVALGQLIGTGGRPVMLLMIQADPSMAKRMADQNLLETMVYGFLWTILGVMMVVGFPITRTAAQALERLGLVKPTVKQVFGGLGMAVALVLAAQVLDPAITLIWKVFGWPPTDSQAFAELMRPAITPMGAVVIGVTAGVGEEMMIRGALQPRVGILLSNLFFTSLHAFQYGFDGLLSVFLVGWVLAVIRARTNTTTSALVHGTYDFILVMMSVLSGH